MKLEDLKVIDIIQMPQFEKHIEALIYKPASKYTAHKCTICRNKTTIKYIRKIKSYGNNIA